MTKRRPHRKGDWPREGWTLENTVSCSIAERLTGQSTTGYLDLVNAGELRVVNVQGIRRVPIADVRLVIQAQPKGETHA